MANQTAKQVAILNTLSGLLESPDAERITTAALAQAMNQSEASLYRHYASKTAILEGFINLIREHILLDLTHIENTEPRGRLRLRKQVYALLLFAERHPGAARVLTGGALTGEAPALQEQLNTLLREILAQLQAGARLSGTQGELDADAQVFAGMLLALVSGKWLHYAQSNWHQKPTRQAQHMLGLLGL